MTGRRRWSLRLARPLLLALLLSPWLAGCGEGRGPTLTVLAAASLTDALRDGAAAVERSAHGYGVRLSFDGSQKLVAEVLAAAPADVVATADRESMQRLVDAGRVEQPLVIARNRLEIAVRPGNPRGIRTLRDLARPGVAAVLADPSVPAGRLARRSLRLAGVAVISRSDELDVRAAVERVQAGDADAAIVYVTDVAATPGLEGVPIPDEMNVITEYPIAVVRASTDHRDAAAFVREARYGAVQRALREHGFLAP